MEKHWAKLVFNSELPLQAANPIRHYDDGLTQRITDTARMIHAEMSLQLGTVQEHDTDSIAGKE